MPKLRVVFVHLTPLLLLTALAGAPRVSRAEPAASTALRAADLQGEAVAALGKGDLAGAVEKAQRALQLNHSNLTLGAREVLFEVALTRGELSWAEAELSRYRAQPELPESAEAWLRRSQERLRAEDAEGWGDVDAAREAVARVKALGSLEPLELSWLAQIDWRLSVREHEQTRDLGAMATALHAAEQRRGLSVEDLRWLKGASARLDLLRAESACDFADARDVLARTRSGANLREPDLRWAQLASERVDLRALDADGQDQAARARLELIASTPGLPAYEQAWVSGYRGRLDLKAALARGDQKALTKLRLSYEDWAAWEPACARLVVPDGSERPPREEPEAPDPWARVGALGGVQGWMVEFEEGWDLSDALVTRDIRARALGVDAAMAWPLWRGLGLRAEALATAALAPATVSGGEPVVGRWAVDGALSATWMRPTWELFAGVEVTHLRFSGSLFEEQVSGWNTEILPRVGASGELPVGSGLARAELAVGALPSAWSVDTRLAYCLGRGEIRPAIGLDGRVVKGLSAGLSHDDAMDRHFRVAQLDWLGVLVLGLEWRPMW